MGKPTFWLLVVVGRLWLVGHPKYDLHVQTFWLGDNKNSFLLLLLLDRLWQTSLLKFKLPKLASSNFMELHTFRVFVMWWCHERVSIAHVMGSWREAFSMDKSSSHSQSQVMSNCMFLMFFFEFGSIQDQVEKCDIFVVCFHLLGLPGPQLDDFMIKFDLLRSNFISICFILIPLIQKPNHLRSGWTVM